MPRQTSTKGTLIPSTINVRGGLKGPQTDHRLVCNSNLGIKKEQSSLMTFTERMQAYFFSFHFRPSATSPTERSENILTDEL